jgi:hypothetical protein
VLTILSILAIRFWLASVGEFIWSFVSVVFVALGVAGLLFVVGYDGIGGWAVNDSRGLVEEFFDSGAQWEGPIFVVAAVLLGIGLIALATAVLKARVLARPAGWAVVAGVVLAIAVPSIAVGWAVYAQSIAAGVASWPIAWRMWRAAPDVRAA